MKGITIVSMPRGPSANTATREFMTANEVAVHLGISKKVPKVAKYLQEEAKLQPDAVHQYGATFHPLWSRAKIEAFNAARQAQANEALRKLTSAAPPPPPTVTELRPAQTPERVLPAGDIIERLNKLSTATSDSETRLREHIQKQLSPLVDMVAELDGQVAKLTKECGALVAYLNDQKK